MPRIVRIHALLESIGPASEAFRTYWPEAECVDLLDTSLSVDRSKSERTQEIAARVSALLDHALSNQGGDGVLFTCSAFGREIRAARKRIERPVFTPNEAAFREVAELGSRVCLLTTFTPSHDTLRKELIDALKLLRPSAQLTAVCVPVALQALQHGDADKHDELIAQAAARTGTQDAFVLGQYSMARAAQAVETLTGARTITTPAAGVLGLRARFANSSASGTNG